MKVIARQAFGDLERSHHRILRFGMAGKILFHGFRIDEKTARAFGRAEARDARFAPSDRPERVAHERAASWAPCGCSELAKTFRRPIMRLRSLFFGSMPVTANSTAFSGR